jgi:hypothetical protein
MRSAVSLMLGIFTSDFRSLVGCRLSSRRFALNEVRVTIEVQ